MILLILNDSFGTQQDGTLQDYNVASLCSKKLQIELLELAVIIKCTMYTNVFIKIIIFVVELWHN